MDLMMGWMMMMELLLVAERMKGKSTVALRALSTDEWKVLL